MTKQSMYTYETKYRLKGFKYIAGIDEVGRGAWAGPIFVSVVILPLNYRNNEINDSKKISKKKREELCEEIKKNALAFSIISISATEVDKLNPKQATRVAMKRAIDNISIKPDCILIDAEEIATNQTQEAIIKGDEKSISIAAASILAKVTRDRYMTEIASKYPQFYFDQHKGYGTKKHELALKKWGAIKGFHRFSYAPIKNIKKIYK